MKQFELKDTDNTRFSPDIIKTLEHIRNSSKAMTQYVSNEEFSLCVVHEMCMSIAGFIEKSIKPMTKKEMKRWESSVYRRLRKRRRQ